MAREALIESAVSFLQDPSVASSPLETRRQFLVSKNLTPDEVRIALARAGEGAQQGAAPASSSRPPADFPFQPPRDGPPGYGYGPGAYGPWAPPPPQYRRDWRDLFIAGTLATGLSYTLYAAAKRWVLPMLAPPTPPQLEADKAGVDASFARAFALLEQLQADTAALQEAERARTERLDAALAGLEATVKDLKEGQRRREDDARRLRDEVREAREAVPRALDGWKAEGDERLREVAGELRGLKTLVGHRVGANTGAGVGAGGAAARSEGSPPAKEPGVLGRYVTSSGGSGSGAGSGLAGLRSASGAAGKEEQGKEGPAGFAKHWTAAERAIPAWQLAGANGAKGGAASGNASASGSQGEDKGESASEATPSS